MRRALVIGILCATGCGRLGFDAFLDDDNSEPDAAGGNDANTGKQDPDADLGTPVALSQNTDAATIIEAWTFGCHNSSVDPWITGENSYIRRFDLAAAGVSSDYSIHSVRIGITRAIAGDGSGKQAAALAIHKVTGALLSANLTQLARVELEVVDQVEQLWTIPIEKTIPGDSVFAVEFFVPDGTDAENTLTLGFNNLGEDQPTYGRMPGCGAPEIIDIDTIDPFYEDFHLIMTVNGTIE